STPKTGSSLEYAEIRISPICACSVCTARLISLALNSDAFECTVILSFPPVALSTSATNWAMFSVWKLVGGYAVGMSHFVCALAAKASAAPTRTAARWLDFILPPESIAGRFGLACGGTAHLYHSGPRARTAPL